MVNTNSNSQTIGTPTQSKQSRRYDYLDNIKWVLTVLVIFHHAASIAGLDAFPINLPLVISSEQYQYSILGTFQSANQSFFMGLFFFISAYFVVPSYNKKGKWLFILDKLKRLGIPVLLTFFIIDPLASFLCDDYSFTQSIVNSFHIYAEMLKSFNIVLGVTWFCWTLIVFNIGYVLYRALTPSQNISDKSSKSIPSFKIILSFAILIIPVNYLGDFLMSVLGENFLGFHLLKYFPMYIAMFCFGIKAHNSNWLEQLTHKMAFVWIIIWILTMIFLQPHKGGMRAISLETIGMSIFLLYSFKHLFNINTRLTQLLSRTAFATYVIQGIPLCFIGKLFTPYMTQLPIVNFLIVGIPSLICSFLLGYIICRLPYLNKVF